MPKTKWESVIFTAYKFFDSKELLFFVVPEDIRTEGFAVAQHSLQGNAALLPAERAAAILAACRWLSETRALVFIENDAEFLLRRLPQDILSTHYHDDEGAAGGERPVSPWRHRSGRRRSGPDPDGLPPGSDRSAVSAGPLPAGPRGLPGAVLTGKGCSDAAFPRDIGSPILTKPFNSPTCQVTGRKVRSWNVIFLFSHCPTPPDVFMIRRKLPRHKDAIYDRQKTIRLRPCEPESYCLPLRMSLSVF